MGGISRNLDEFPQGRTDEIAAKKAGFGNKDTYRQAKTVVENAEPELVDASMMEFSDDYAMLSPVQEPKWRVKSLLMKLDSDDRHDTDYANKFVRKAEEIFAGLPKPKDWHTFQKHDLPLLFTPAEVQEFALKHRLNKSQTKADWMKDFTEKLAADNSVKWTDFDPPIYNVWKQQGIPPHARGSTIKTFRTAPSRKVRPTRAGAHKQDGTVPFTRTAAASAIRRYGELLKQIEPDKGGYHGNYAHDGTDTRITRTEAATQAGISERQKVTARSFQTRQTPCPQHRGNPRVPAPENLPGLLSQHRCSGLPASAP